MKQKLLLSILPMLLFVATLQAQTKIWDFGGDATYTSAEQIALWPVVAYNAAEATTVEKDNIFMVGDSSGDQFGEIENAGAATWDAGTGDEYGAINRFKFNGSGASIGAYIPTHSYIYIPVTDDVDVKIWYRPSGTGERYLYITDGTNLLGSSSWDGTTDANTLTASYTDGTPGTIYIYGAGNSINIYKIDVTGPGAADLVLGTEDVNVVSTNIKAIGDRIYVSNVKTSTEVNIYSITGALVKSLKTNTDTDFSFKTGLWIASVKTVEGQKAVKLVTQ
jgi:hypothetical protein